MMNPNYEIRLSVTDDKFKVIIFEQVKSHDLIQLMAQLGMLLLRVQRDLHEAEMLDYKSQLMKDNDDIPF